MKIRSDFVSNSSSSSFIIDNNHKGLKEFFIEFKELFVKLHSITCIFESHKDSIVPLYNEFIKYQEVQNWLETNPYNIDYDKERGTIDFYPQILADDKLFNICWQTIMEPCDQIEIGIADSFGSYNFAMHQILTLLEYKGFNFVEGYSEEGWVKMNLKNKNQED